MLYSKGEDLAARYVACMTISFELVEKLEAARPRLGLEHGVETLAGCGGTVPNNLHEPPSWSCELNLAFQNSHSTAVTQFSLVTLRQHTTQAPYERELHFPCCLFVRIFAEVQFLLRENLALATLTSSSLLPIPLANERAMSLTKQSSGVDAGEGSSSGAVATREIPPVLVDQQKSSLPSFLRFPLVAILSFSISSLGYSFINEFTRGELATVMRTLDTSREVNIMTAWRLAELALGWFANFDSLDLAALNFLSHSPTVSN